MSPLSHIILIPSQPVFALSPYCRMRTGKQQLYIYTCYSRFLYKQINNFKNNHQMIGKKLQIITYNINYKSNIFYECFC
jgi:hypothetical protein